MDSGQRRGLRVLLDRRHLKEDREMSEGNPERQGQEGTEEQEEKTRKPAPEAPEEEAGVPPTPEKEEIREGVEEGTDDAIKP
jgi:hypothetical protein